MVITQTYRFKFYSNLKIPIGVYIMSKVSLLMLTLLIISMLPALTSLSHVEASGKTVGTENALVVAIDLAHGENDKAVDEITSVIDFVEWRIIDTAITSDVLDGVSILLIGQPMQDFSSDEVLAILDWLGQGGKAIWIASDSDYGQGPSSQATANNLLEAIGSRLRIETAAIYDDVHNCKAFYRVLGHMDPDNIPGLFTHILSESITRPILFHGPTAVIWVDDAGVPHDPLNETFDGFIRIAWSYDTAYVGDNNPPLGMLYEAGMGGRPFLFVGAEYFNDTQNLIVASGESPYGDYMPGWTDEYYGVPLDGPRYVYNMIRWMASVIAGSEVGSPDMKLGSFSDPEGDDNGPGTYVYPTNAVFVDGVFDLTGFEVYDTPDNKLVFKVYVRNLNDNPWSGPNNFSLQYVHIYVLTPIDEPVNTTTLGLNVEVPHGWHFALLLAPGWETQPVPVGQRSALYYANGTAIAQDDTSFIVYADWDENSITAVINESLLPGGHRAVEWIYAVALTSYDGFGPMRVRPVQPGDPSEWVIGGGDALAILAGVEPRVMDVLAPTASDQYAMLNSYDTELGEPACIVGWGMELLFVNLRVSVEGYESYPDAKVYIYVGGSLFRVYNTTYPEFSIPLSNTIYLFNVTPAIGETVDGMGLYKFMNWSFGEFVVTDPVLMVELEGNLTIDMFFKAVPLTGPLTVTETETATVTTTSVSTTTEVSESTVTTTRVETTTTTSAITETSATTETTTVTEVSTLATTVETTAYATTTAVQPDYTAAGIVGIVMVIILVLVVLMMRRR